MKYVLGVFGVFVVAILAIILVTRGRGGGPDQEGERQIVLSEEAKPGTSAAFTTQGQLVGENLRRSIRVKVSEEERRLEILAGYDEAVERSFVFANTPAAYETFLVALEQAGFTREVISRIEDERGACPLGKRYIYEFKEFSQLLIRLWDTSCGKSEGETFGGDSTTIRRLFEGQIPDYRDKVREVDLNP